MCGKNIDQLEVLRIFSIFYEFWNALIKDFALYNRRKTNVHNFSYRYFKLKPQQQQMFPAFANVPLIDLPTNNHFLNQAFTCVSSLNTYIDHLGENPKNCPYLTSDKFNVDPKVVKVIFLSSLIKRVLRFTPHFLLRNLGKFSLPLWKKNWEIPSLLKPNKSSKMFWIQ